MSISDVTRQFLIDTKELIINNDFEEAYNYVNEHAEMLEATWFTEATGEYTQALLDAGVNPINYMNKVPESYLFSVDSLGLEVDLPSRVNKIGEYAFSSAVLGKIYIKGLPDVHSSAFFNTQATVVCTEDMRLKIHNICIRTNELKFEVV